MILQIVDETNYTLFVASPTWLAGRCSNSNEWPGFDHHHKVKEGIVQQPDTNGWPPNDQDKNYYIYAFRLTLIKKDSEGAGPY